MKHTPSIPSPSSSPLSLKKRSLSPFSLIKPIALSLLPHQALSLSKNAPSLPSPLSSRSLSLSKICGFQRTTTPSLSKRRCYLSLSLSKKPNPDQQAEERKECRVSIYLLLQQLSPLQKS
ncbi:hypothetical protein CFOL_v3_28505 [Cephalotus follicularis]|uniref:Uncharacterized protein n=1 Tax=Cephalotus follicularis TaxID=3775 RepID=A0A1Q3CXT9_CEPFO|nr:hypothetical protein CFOL_v3_28505 [Cephalotus follicularis]